MKDPQTSLRERLFELKGEKGNPSISWKTCREIAVEEGLLPAEVERIALECGLVPDRYERNIGTLGLEGQRRLLSSRAAVIGCGGLGGLVVELLARSGVGELVLVDGDVFAPHNLNRQILCTEALLGRFKVDVAAERVLEVNGAVKPHPHREFLTEGNAKDLLAGCGVAVDALDSHAVRRVLFDAAGRLGIPVVHGAVGGFWGQLSVVFPKDPSPLDVWGESLPESGAESQMGTPSFAPAAVASLEAAEAVKILAGVGSPARGCLVWMDFAEMRFQRLPLAREPGRSRDP